MMAGERKVVGQAVALKQGEYVRPDGSRYWVEEGTVFDVVQGLEKGRWFAPVEAGKQPVFAKAPAPAEVPGAGPKRGSKAKVEVSGDDIA